MIVREVFSTNIIIYIWCL